MRIIEQNTEARLLETAYKIRTESSSWRCIYAQFSALKRGAHDDIRSKVALNDAKALLKETQNTAFVCSDYDMFILTQGVGSDVLKQVQKSFQTLVEAEGGNPDCIACYDLGPHWKTFFKVVCDKNQTPQAREEDTAPKKAAPAQTTVKAPSNTSPLTLPPTGENLALAKEALTQRTQREGLQILVVEDDAFSRRIVRNALRNVGEILEAADLQQATEHYLLRAPDIVFLDINLPDGDGIAFLEQIVGWDSEAFVVMLSGNSFKEHIMQSMQKGAKGFVAKPFSKEKLLDYIHMHKENGRG